VLKKFKLTEKRKEIAEKIYNELNNIIKVKLNEFIEIFEKYTLIGLLNYIYNKHPEESKRLEK